MNREAAATLLEDAFRPIVEAYLKQVDPGTSDLDNEQPFHITVPLGDLRRAHLALLQAGSLA